MDAEAIPGTAQIYYGRGLTPACWWRPASSSHLSEVASRLCLSVEECGVQLRLEINKNQETSGKSVQQAWVLLHSSHPFVAKTNANFATCETRRLRTPEHDQTGQGLIAHPSQCKTSSVRESTGLSLAVPRSSVGFLQNLKNTKTEHSNLHGLR